MTNEVASAAYRITRLRDEYHIGLQDYGGAIEFRGIKLQAVEATGK